MSIKLFCDRITSLEIAQITNKQHKNILADIRKMFVDLNMDIKTVETSKKMDSGQTAKVYKLDKELTTTLLSGYHVKIRHILAKHWAELESQFVMPSKDELLTLTYNETVDAAMKIWDKASSKESMDFCLERDLVEFELTMLTLIEENPYGLQEKKPWDYYCGKGYKSTFKRLWDRGDIDHYVREFMDIEQFNRIDRELSNEK